MSFAKDHALQIVRRLDWRFLLPNPNLGHVAYIGPPSGTLPFALKQFSELLTMVSKADESRVGVKVDGSHEVVVLRSADVAAVDNVKPLLTSGGYLYWEVERASSLRHVRDYIAPIERLGFDDIQVSWHRPDFESCLEIIPLRDPVALRFAFARSRGSVSKRVKFAAGRFLMTAGLLARVVPCFSIIARNGSPEEGSA